MKGAALPLAIAVLCLVIAIFYLVPGPTHPFVSDDPTGSHVKHSLLFFGLAVLGVVWARFSRNTRLGDAGRSGK